MWPIGDGMKTTSWPVKVQARIEAISWARVV
jgi:hypothetical protein